MPHPARVFRIAEDSLSAPVASHRALTSQGPPSPFQSPANGLPGQAPPVRHLDPWLTIAPALPGQPLASVAAHIARALPKPHASVASQEASARRLAILATILANVVEGRALAPPRPAIALSLGNLRHTRCDRPETASARHRRTVLLALDAEGWIATQPHKFKRLRTTFSPTAKLLALLASHGVTASCLARLPDGEVIELVRRDSKRHNADSENGEDDEGGEAQGGTSSDPSRYIDYPDDCEAANSQRTRLRRFNAFLSAQDVRLIGLADLPPFKPFKRIFSTTGPIAFDMHGRLYEGHIGGWHQGLPSTERHRIRINDEEVADLDFSSMWLRLAYAKAAASPPQGDLYAIPGLDALERSAVKTIALAMLAKDGPLTKLPMGSGLRLPKGMTAKTIALAIAAHHAPIAHLFGRDLSHALMFTESEILMTALERLMGQGIPALPMHDGLMVQSSSVASAIAAMQSASLAVIGIALPVERKPIASL